MTYKLKFHPKALKEWNKLPAQIRDLFKEKLKERLKDPHVPGSRLTGAGNIYKIKFKNPPFRLAYHADDTELTVTTLSVGKRDSDVYKEMLKRLKD